MVDVICEASVSQLSDISTLDSITFLQLNLLMSHVTINAILKRSLETNSVTRKTCIVIHLSITASRQKTRNKKRACHGDMELAKRTSLKKIFKTACIRRLLGGPPPLKNFFLQVYTHHT